MIEIERKYLVKNNSWRDKVKESLSIVQGYIKSEEATVRIRRYIDTKKAVITIKGKRRGLSRAEFEYPIPYKDAKEIQITLCQDNLIKKTRHLINYNDMLWELDEFYNENAGLFVAEVEMTHEKQEFNLPDWVGDDVSFEPKYRNSRLARFPYLMW